MVSSFLQEEKTKISNKKSNETFDMVVIWF
jgi:hypothetical protein